MPEPVRELLDLAAVHAFYLDVLEYHLGHAIPVPHAVGGAAGAAGERAAQSVLSLKGWLDLLDLAITAPMVRDALKDSTTDETAEALLRYFVAKQSRAASDREKADFIVTFLYRCFAPAPEARQEVCAGEPAPDDQASPFEQEIYRVLGAQPVPPLPEEHRQLVREFHFLRLEVGDFRHFDELMDSGLMQRVRDIKQRFGASFYHPRVLATVAEYNASFGGRFDQLFRDTTAQIKSYAARVQQEGGSIMSRVQGDVIVKHLAEVEEKEIMATEYGRAQESFRQVSKMKKAVDSRGAARRAATAAAEIATPPVTMPAHPVPHGGKDLIEEGKLQGVKDSIRNFVRAAQADAMRVVPLRHGNLSLSVAEAEAFRADYGAEKSFRAEFAEALRAVIVLQARMLMEVEDFHAKRTSAYLWKPHADSLAYLLRSAEQLMTLCGGIMATAQQRGLSEKSNALNAALQKLRTQVQVVAKTLQGLS